MAGWLSASSPSAIAFEEGYWCRCQAKVQDKQMEGVRGALMVEPSSNNPITVQLATSS